MRIYDRLAKEALLSILSAARGELVAERELSAEPQRVDLWYVPDAAELAALAPFGLLLRIANAGPAALEFFHEAPSLDELLGSLRKAFLLRQPARVPARHDEPWLWVIAGGRPAQGLRELGLKPETGWPKGVYSGARGLRFRLIVTSELPATEETLVLRCLGAGKTLRNAQRELHARGLSDPIAAIVLPLMVALHFEGLDADANDLENKEFLMDTRDTYEAWHKKVLDAGRREGLDAGKTEGRREEAARAILAVLTARGLTISAEQSAAIAACRDLAKLETWLSRAVSVVNPDDLLGS